MYKLFFWDSIDISIRGVVVPDNDIGIEETLDHERGICYDVINFTYPDSRIGILSCKFLVRTLEAQTNYLCPGKTAIRGIRILLIMYCNNNNYGGEKFFPIPICRVQFKGLQVDGWGGGAKRTVRRFGGLLGRYIGGMRSPSIRMRGCQSCYLLFPSL